MPPLKLLPLVVQIKNAWADDWVTMPDVEPISASLSAANVGSFQFRLRYGYVKYPVETQITLKDHTQANRQWVRCLRAPYEDTDILFQGRIESDTRELYGAVSGIQVFTAYDGIQLLKKIEIQSSIVLQDGGKKTIDWLLPFNRHPTSRQETGNRSANKVSGNYIFKKRGDQWTVDNAIEYLLNEFVNEPDAPVWTVSGSIPNELEPFDLGEKVTALSFLRAVLNQRAGYSFVVLPTAAGYTLKLFSMAITDVTFGSITIPANPESVVVSNSVNPEITLRIEESHVNTHNRVTVLGRPMVICRSFSVDDDELTKAWETGSYLSLIGQYVSADDEGRMDQRFKNLWCRFAVNNYSAKWTGNNNPTLEPDGTLDFATAGPVPQFSASLESLPIKTGNEYVDGNPANEYEGEFLSPLFFVKNYGGQWREFQSLRIDADLIALPDEIGIHLRTNHPHVMAAGSYGLSELKGETPAVFDISEAVLTIAFNSGQRLRREYVGAGAKKSDGEIIINVEDAEFWWLATGAAIGIYGEDKPPSETEGELKTVNPSLGVTLRDDGPRLDRIMAGAVARYITPRGKASGSADGLFVWHLDIGKVLVTDDPDVQSILTMVSWTFENGFKTTLKSGFAIR